MSSPRNDDLAEEMPWEGEELDPSIAFDKLHESFRNAVYRFVDLRLDAQLRQRVSASDLVQETFAEVHRRLEDFARRRPMPLRVWLLKTAAEQLRDARVKHLKRARRAVGREVQIPNRSSVLLARQLTAATTPSEIVVKRESGQQVAAIIGEMSQSDQEILLLRHIDELKFDEIGSLLDIQATAARKRYTRAVLRLQKLCSTKGLRSEAD